MRTLSIDIETWCVRDLTKVGVYKYAEVCEIIIFAYKYDNGPTVVVDCTKRPIPASVIRDMQDPSIIKKAFNAAFEIACISSYLDIELVPEQWRCTMVHCAMAGLPMSLDAAAKVLGGTQKDSVGKSLIRFFCIPCKPTKVNGYVTRNLPVNHPDKWRQFMDYCGTDVDAEHDVSRQLSFYKVTPEAHAEWCLDHRINERGFLVDSEFAKRAIEIDVKCREQLINEAVKISGLANPNSRAQLIEWLSDEMFEEITSLKKADLPKYLERCDSEAGTRMLQIRQELSKTSVKKYASLLGAVCEDGRLRGSVQHYGAGRTGRGAGRIFQPHNLPKGDEFSDIDFARFLVMQGDAESLEMFYGAVPVALSVLIRSSIMASAGNTLPVADFSAIEARVIAWLAGEQWRIDVFNGKGKIYEASASQMFKVPIESITKEGYHRKAGKVAELALGYQGGVNALALMCESQQIYLPPEDFPNIVAAWRKASPNIVKYWATCNKAAINAIQQPGEKFFVGKGIYFQYTMKHLFITLPSGRKLIYYNAYLVDGKFGKAVKYYGQLKNKWFRLDAYGGKFVENIVQAVARDCLYFALKNVDDAGYDIVLHVHDEIVCEGNEGSIAHIEEIMAEVPPWAKGLPLRADGFETKYYRK